MEGHICRQNTLMFALVFCFELRARAARTCCHCHLQAAVKNPIHDGKRGQLKLPKKVMNGTTMWSCDTELCTNGVEATKCWVFVAHFSIYSTSRCRCHTGTDIPRLRGHTLQINQVVRTVRHRISCCAPTIHWKCDAQIQNRQIKSPPALWKHLSFQCLGVIVTLNGKSASMLLEPTKNKLKQWRVIEKSVNKCNFFSQMFWIITKWMKITEKQICEDQIVTFKQSHILLYQGLLLLTRSTCVIVDARSHTCKSHDFIPRCDIIPFMQYHTVSIWNVYSIHIMCRCNHAWMFILYHDNALMDTLRPTRNRQYFADDIFKRIFVNERVWILINISLKFVPKGPINNFPVLVQMMMAWRRSGDKTLSEPIMISLPTHICVTRPQSVKWGWRKKLHTHFHQKFHVAFYS